MKTIFRVAKTELRTLFYSPIAWFLLIVFLVQCGIGYFSALTYFARQQEMSGSINYLNHLTENVFVGARGLFSSVMQKLYLYIPLLTMGLISRETSSGTIRLLYSSPIRVRDIVLGKFLSMMIYNLLLVAIISLFVVTGLFHIQSPDTGMLLIALLGFYLLLCTYAAIGLFMSCLTTYQVVAAVSTFVMIAILSYIGTVWQGYDFARDLTYFLAINGRTQKMLVGLLTTKDLVYFIVIMYMFLGCSIYKLKAGMESKPALVKAGRYVAIIASGLLIGYITSRPSLTGYYDATANKSRTLTPQVQQIIKDFGDAPLEVTAYVNLMDSYKYLGLPEARNADLARWESYMRFKSDIRLRYTLYYDSTMDAAYMGKVYPGKSMQQLAAQYAKSSDLKLSLFKTPAEIRKMIDLRPEQNRYVMQLKYKDRTSFLRVYNDPQVWPGETEVAAAFKRLQQARLPRIAFLTGNLERDIHKLGDREYKTLTNQSTFRYSLVNQGFDVDTLSAETGLIPEGISALVIADPKTAFSPVMFASLQQYIHKGGNLLIAGEPGKQAILNPLLQQLGVQLLNGTLVQQSKEQAPDLLLPLLTATAGGFTRAVKRAFDDSVKIAMPGAAALMYTDTGAFVIKPLLMTDARYAWLKKGTLVADSANVLFDAAGGDLRQPFPVAVSLTRQLNGREQRIVVTGDADYMSNKELNRYNVRTANFVFNTSLFSWLSDGAFPIDTSRPPAKDNKVKVTVEEAEYLAILYEWVLPGLLLAFAAILLIRRKRK